MFSKYLLKEWDLGSQDNSAIHELCEGAMAVVRLLYCIPLDKAQKHNVEWERKVNSRQ